MRRVRVRSRTLAMFAMLIPLLGLFVYVALYSGPLAPVAVTTTLIESRGIAPALSGIGTVQARYTYKIGPTFSGRVKQLDVHVGDAVKAGQVLGTMDSVDLDDRIRAQQATINSAQAALRQAEATHVYAKTQAKRYEQLVALRGTTEEKFITKQLELAMADAALLAAQEDLNRLHANLEALRTQRRDLDLIAPVSGLLVMRNADPGTTVVAGQAVVEIIDPASLWVDTRFDQISAQGLVANAPASIVIRSRQGQNKPGHIVRVEPLADAVTEEMLAKIAFDTLPSPLPPIGELAEITVSLPILPAAPTVPNAAIRTVDGVQGVWKLDNNRLKFIPVTFGRSDLDGNVQALRGLIPGDRIVVYSEKALTARNRIHVVDHIDGLPS